MLKVKVKIRADLKLMRERFAIIVSKYGIELNATSRSVRGESEKLRILRVTTMKKDKQTLSIKLTNQLIKILKDGR